MNVDGVPIIGMNKVSKPIHVELELPALFSCQVFFINGRGEMLAASFNLPPGVYPNKDWVEKLVRKEYNKCLKDLKLNTKDLSWRKPTPHEFVKATAGGAPVTVVKEWKEPFTVKFSDAETLEAESDNDSV